MASIRQPRLLEEGDKAPDFELDRLEGGQVSLKQLLMGGPVLLVFFKVSCPVCQMTLPFLDRIHRGDLAQSLRIFGISQDDPNATRAFNHEFGVSFPMLLDTEARGYPVSNAYGLSHVPSMFLIETDGTVTTAVEGFSKAVVLRLGALAGVKPFHADEFVPEWKSG